MVVVSDNFGATDGTMYNFVSGLKTEATIVLVAWAENFQFNEKLNSIKNAIIIDACEYGYSHNFDETGTHIWGKNSERFQRYYTDEWVKFDDWVKQNPPKLLLKRELLKQDVSDKVKPIEYPAIFDIPEPQSKKQFLSRPISLFNYWGRSNEERLRVHGEFWLNGYRMGWAVCDNIYYLQKFLEEESNPKKFVSLNIPHYARIEMGQIMTINALSKVSLSLSGAGKKCFRHSESPINSIMAMEDSGMAFSFPWDEKNSIQFKVGDELSECVFALIKKDMLYETYLNGIENCKNYQISNYTKHIESLINNAV